MEKINVAELLKDCPKGMELDCTMFENVTLVRVDTNKRQFPIEIAVSGSLSKYLTKEGCFHDRTQVPESKCVIFPKGKTTWEGFVPPCQFKVGNWITNGDYTWKVISVDDFDYTLQNQWGEYVDDTIDYVNKAFHLWTINDAKDGDVLVCDINKAEIGGDIEKLPNIVSTIFSFKKVRTSRDYIHSYCHLYDRRFLGLQSTTYYNSFVYNISPATKEQSDILFQKIREVGYIWDSEKKALEKIFPYNIGTKVWVKSDKEHKYLHTIVGISRNSFGNLEYEVKEEKTGIVVHYPKELLIPITKEPTFKVGDRVRGKYTNNVYTITRITPEGYELTNGQLFTFGAEDYYELVPAKFDINTLIPFESKVLVRHNKDNKWTGSFFSFIDRDLHSHCYKFVTTADKSYPMMIPYKGNEYLLGKTDDCQDFYKIWE